LDRQPEAVPPVNKLDTNSSDATNLITSIAYALPFYSVKGKGISNASNQVRRIAAVGFEFVDGRDSFRLSLESDKDVVAAVY